MPSTDDSELRAFVQKLREKGSDAFAAGPWKDQDEARRGEQETAKGASGHLPAAEEQRHAAARGNTQQSRAKPGHAKVSAPGFENRVLTGLAMIALGVFIVGSLGLYLSYRPELKAIASPGTSVEPESPEPQQLQFGDIEQQLNKITGRLEKLSTEIAALSSNNDLVQNMNQTLLASPPAALPPGPETGMPMHTMAAHPEPDLRITSFEQEEISATLQDGENTGTPQPESEDHEKVVSATPLDRENIISPQLETEDQEIVSAAPLDRENIISPQLETEDQEIVSAAPLDREDTGFPQLETANQGRWVINLASCTKEKTAKKMQADFLQKGIDTEVITTSVNGKTMYRIRIPGFGSRKSAQSRATSLNRELDVKGAWVMEGG